MPQTTALQLIQSALSAGQEPELGIQTPFEMLNPLVQLAISLGQGRTKFGQAKPAQEILRQEFPAPGYMRYLWKKPSNIYADRDWYHTLLRAFRLPYRINETEAANQASR
jgi:hypothetical protein